MYIQYSYEKYRFSAFKINLVFDMHLRCNKFDETLHLKCVDFLGDFCYSSRAISHKVINSDFILNARFCQKDYILDACEKTHYILNVELPKFSGKYSHLISMWKINEKTLTSKCKVCPKCYFLNVGQKEYKYRNTIIFVRKYVYSKCRWKPIKKRFHLKNNFLSEIMWF